VTEEAQLDLLAIAFPSEFAEERQTPAGHAEIPAIVLDLPDFLERSFVERRFDLRFGPLGTQQTAPAVISEQVRMHADKAGGGIE
jgi:hypothetical protein